MGPTSTLSLAPKYPELGIFSSSCSKCFQGKLASDGSEHPPQRSEFETWPSHQPREVFQPLSCYVSIHHHMFLQANFFCLCPGESKEIRFILLTERCLKVSMLHTSDTPSPDFPVTPSPAPVIVRVCKSSVFSSFLSACLLTSETPFSITSTFWLSALFLCKP